MTAEAPRECPRTLSGAHVYSRTVGGRDYCACGEPRPAIGVSEGESVTLSGMRLHGRLRDG